MTDLSDPACSMPPMTWHPWRYIRTHLADVDVTWDLPDGKLGTWCGASRSMAFHSDQSQAQRRCTATHEIVHAELAHEGPCTAATELVVRKIAARRLIPVADLARAVLAYGERDRAALAEELWVDRETLDVRLAHLHPSERGYLRQRLAMKEHAS